MDLGMYTCSITLESGASQTRFFRPVSTVPLNEELRKLRFAQFDTICTVWKT